VRILWMPLFGKRPVTLQTTVRHCGWEGQPGLAQARRPARFITIFINSFREKSKKIKLQ